MIRMQPWTKSKRRSGRRLLKSIPIRVVILRNGKRSLLPMMCCLIKTREKCMTKVEKKEFNKVDTEEVVEISSLKCSVVAADLEDHKRERVFNMQLK